MKKILCMALFIMMLLTACSETSKNNENVPATAETQQEITETKEKEAENEEQKAKEEEKEKERQKITRIKEEIANFTGWKKIYAEALIKLHEIDSDYNSFILADLNEDQQPELIVLGFCASAGQCFSLFEIKDEKLTLLLGADPVSFSENNTTTDLDIAYSDLYDPNDHLSIYYRPMFRRSDRDYEAFVNGAFEDDGFDGMIREKNKYTGEERVFIYCGNGSDLGSFGTYVSIAWQNGKFNITKDFSYDAQYDCPEESVWYVYGKSVSESTYDTELEAFLNQWEDTGVRYPIYDLIYYSSFNEGILESFSDYEANYAQ